MCLNKCTISSTGALNAEAGPDLQYAENVRAALRWVALREKGINHVYVCVCARVCVCVYASVKLGLTEG